MQYQQQINYRQKHSIYPGLVLCLLFLLQGCGATTAVKDVFTTITQADIRIVAAANMNPDMDGRPSPILLRMYELKSPVAFNNADFFALYDSDVAELGPDYVARKDVELKPGDVIEMAQEFNEQTRFLGIIAAYRDIDTATWKKVLEIKPDSDSEILIEVKDTGVVITQQ